MAAPHVRCIGCRQVCCIPFLGRRRTRAPGLPRGVADKKAFAHSLCNPLENRAPCASIRSDGPNVREVDLRVRSGLYSTAYSISALDTLKWHKRIHFAH